jgi:hypothetical protein
VKLVAIVRPPASLDDAARALADAQGLALAEARMRLAPEPPALLARLDPGRAGPLVAALRGAGLAAVAVDTPCPTDRDRTVAHGFSLDDAGVTATPRFGEPVTFRWGEVIAILRGVRASRSEVEGTEKTKRFSVATTIATGGLWTTATATTRTRSSEESMEQVILVYPRDGPAAAFAESRLEFSCLGAGMQPSSTGNMLELARRLRAGAPGAFYDERLVRLGRRPLPFLATGESRSRTATSVTTRTDTSGALDALAEVMRQALADGLLP